MNFDLVLEKIFRGDFVRMNTVADGYGGRSHPTLKARVFSIEKALHILQKAGFQRKRRRWHIGKFSRERLSVELLTGYRHFEDVLVVLKEQAKKAGLELKLKVLEPTAAWKAANEKIIK